MNEPVRKRLKSGREIKRVLSQARVQVKKRFSDVYVWRWKKSRATKFAEKCCFLWFFIAVAREEWIDRGESNKAEEEADDDGGEDEELKWYEMRWDEMGWDEMRWGAMRCDEMRWDEMRWQAVQLNYDGCEIDARDDEPEVKRPREMREDGEWDV
jgi:hypothetical protein